MEERSDDYTLIDHMTKPPQVTGSNSNDFYFVANGLRTGTSIEYKNKNDNTPRQYNLVYDFSTMTNVTFIRFSYHSVSGNKVYWIANNILYTYKINSNTPFEFMQLPWTLP